jgi:3D (Asp-Asp-Asp) domain-containing protein
VKTVKEKGNILRFASFSKGPIISIIVLLFCVTTNADQSDSSLLVHINQGYIVKSETIRVVTAYNAGDPRQTDGTPCISANGENLCMALEKGQMRCAANFVPLGSHLYIDKIGVCLVTDRTNKRYRNRVDIAMRKNEYQKARRFGRQKLHVKIIVVAPYDIFLASFNGTNF